jgi:hypothetical protein
MADETSKEKVVIDFSTNANAARKETDGLRESIDATVTATEEQTQAVEQQDTAYKTLKTQLREAREEQQKLSAQYGATSQEAIKAARAVAEISDEIGFQNDLVDSYNPDQKFKALGAATQVAGTGLQGVTAGMALFGGESEDTQKQLLKVQAAMAFSDAISNLSNVADQWAILKTAISSSTIIQKANTAATGAAAIVQNLFTGSVTTTTTGFKALKFAIAATGIGLLVVGLVAIVQNFDKISKVATNLFPSLAGVGKGIMSIVEAVTDFIGVTSEADRAISRMKSNADASLALNKKFLAEHGSQLDEFTKQKIAAKDEYNNAIKEDGANQAALAAELNRQLAAIEYSRGDEARKIQIENKEKADAVSKKINDNKLAEEKRIADEELAEEKRIADEKLANEMNLAREAIKILDELAKEKESPSEKEQREYEEKKVVLEANNLQTQDLYTSHLAKLSEIERLDKEKRAEEENASFAADADKSIKISEENKKISDAKDNLQKESKDRMLQNGEALARGVAALAGKNKAIQKAAIIAEGGINLGKTIANTATAISSDLKLGFPANIAPIALDVAVGAMSTASIISGTQKALQAVGGGGSISAPSSPTVPTGVSAAPQTSFQSSSENQIATSINGVQNQQPVIKAFVVSSDMTDQQAKDAKLVSQNSIG